MTKAQTHINKLELQPHIEGGHFKEIYTCATKLQKRSIASSIYFLLQEGDFSAFHVIGKDEQWVYVDGSSVKIHMISESGEYSFVRVGVEYSRGELPAFVVPANTYFASESTGEYSLAVCNVFPSFSYEDFKLLKRDELNKKFPELKDVIMRLTRL